MKGEKELSQEDMMKEMHGKIAEIHAHLGIKKKKPTPKEAFNKAHFFASKKGAIE